jgi:hypothetical protein
MDITEIFEIYICPGNDYSTPIVKRTTQYCQGDYQRAEDGSLMFNQDFVNPDDIQGDKKKFVKEQNVKTAKLLESHIRPIKFTLQKKGSDIKFERQLAYLDLVKSNLISWFIDHKLKYPINLNEKPAIILADGFGSATLNEINYPLTKAQGAIIKVLYNSYLNNTPFMLSKDILLQAEELLFEVGISTYIEGDKISDIFKSNRDALKALIVRQGQSHYRLNI